MISRPPLAWLLAAAACIPAAASSNAAAPPAARAAPGSARYATVAGHYELRGGPDSASELNLLPNGHFQFLFGAGALDLAAEGHWTSDGHNVILNTEPRPVPPVFSAGPAEHRDGRLRIKVTNPAGRGLALVDLQVGFADGHVVDGYTQDYGWQLAEAEDVGAARWVELTVRMYGLTPQRFTIDPAAGHDLTFILTPNDLGVQDFHDAVLPITREGLVLNLLGGSGTYVRQGRGH